jgi:hypothetical protein
MLTPGSADAKCQGRQAGCKEFVHRASEFAKKGMLSWVEKGRST